MREKILKRILEVFINCSLWNELFVISQKKISLESKWIKCYRFDIAGILRYDTLCKRRDVLVDETVGMGLNAPVPTNKKNDL